MYENGGCTSVLPLGEGAAKPGIEWPEGTYFRKAECAYLG